MPHIDLATLPLAPEYPDAELFNAMRLPVSKFHTLYVEESGNPAGIPVLFLHGGPGSGCSEKHRKLFDPHRFRTIIHDQRGAGRSTPHASLQENSTWDLVSDIEKIREELNIDQWIVYGGSWGSTLALAYAQSFPKRCASLVLRGIFLGRKQEIDHFYQSGAHLMSPIEWEEYVELIPLNERDDIIGAYHKRLTSPDTNMRLEACKRWAHWELSNCALVKDQAFIDSLSGDDVTVSLARIECHYFMSQCFFNEDNAILNPDRIAAISHIPITIVQGRYDLVCPPSTAWELYRALPNAHFILAPEAGHAGSEKGVKDALHWAVHDHAPTTEAFAK